MDRTNRSNESNSFKEENTVLAELFTSEDDASQNINFGYQNNNDIYLEDYREGIPK
ncbi:4772_t:CDS:1, partial [Scutellospora calospora]